MFLLSVVLFISLQAPIPEFIDPYLITIVFLSLFFRYIINPHLRLSWRELGLAIAWSFIILAIYFHINQRIEMIFSQGNLLDGKLLLGTFLTFLLSFLFISTLLWIPLAAGVKKLKWYQIPLAACTMFYKKGDQLITGYQIGFFFLLLSLVVGLFIPYVGALFSIYLLVLWINWLYQLMTNKPIEKTVQAPLKGSIRMMPLLGFTILITAYLVSVNFNSMSLLGLLIGALIPFIFLLFVQIALTRYIIRVVLIIVSFTLFSLFLVLSRILLL